MAVFYFTQARYTKRCWSCAHWSGHRRVDILTTQIEVTCDSHECLLDSTKYKRYFNSECDKWTLLGGVPNAPEVKKECGPFDGRIFKKVTEILFNREPVSEEECNEDSPVEGTSYKNESPYTPSSYTYSGNKTAHGIEAVEQIESIFNFFAALLSYIVYAVCWILKISLPATNKELLREVAKRLGSVARLRNTLTEKEYLANMKEIEVLKNLAGQIPEDYDPSFLIAQKILFGIVVFSIVALVAASI